jgi:hypothetical protein
LVVPRSRPTTISLWVTGVLIAARSDQRPEQALES